MISPEACLTIQIIPLARILVWEVQERYVERCLHYIQLLRTHPGQYAGLVSVAPSRDYPGLYELLDGHHRYTASLLVGRCDMLCLVIEEPEESYVSAPCARD